MARSKNTQQQLAIAVAETKVIPLWQLRCLQSALRKFERTGSAFDMFNACKLVYGKGYDTPTMASKIAATLDEYAEVLAHQ